MPIIRVDMLKGRTKKQKQNLVKELTQAFNRACGENHVGTVSYTHLTMPTKRIV